MTRSQSWQVRYTPPTNPQGSEVTFTLPGGVPLVLVKIPAGTFQMGSPPTERNRWVDETLHQVTLTSDYYIGKYEVTQAQWRAVMGTNPSDSSPVVATARCRQCRGTTSAGRTGSSRS